MHDVLLLLLLLLHPVKATQRFPRGTCSSLNCQFARPQVYVKQGSIEKILKKKVLRRPLGEITTNLGASSANLRPPLRALFFSTLRPHAFSFPIICSHLVAVLLCIPIHPLHPRIFAVIP